MKIRTDVGFIGTGGIATALAKGFCNADDFAGKIYVFDINESRTEDLRRSCPDKVVVAGSNQELIDRAEVVFPTLLPHVLEQVAPSLHFRKENRIIHIAAGIKIEKARPWFEPATSVVRAVPLPFASKRIGPVVLYGDDRMSASLLSLLGSVVSVVTEKDLEVLASVTGLMVSYYALVGEIVGWCGSKGMEFPGALEYTNRMFGALSDLMRLECGFDVEAFLMENITPSGTNELALNMLRANGAFKPWIDALDKIGERYDL